MRTMTFAELAYEVIARFVAPEDIPADILRDIIGKSFAAFRTEGRNCSHRLSL